MSTNKNAQFTPGPWVINTFTVDGQNKLEVLDANGGNACVQANATLIAAAPAMYEALKMLLKHEGERVVSGIGTEHDSEALETAKIIARTALAQAEGRKG